ncbi:hypothetical protein ACH5RR_036660 [Cinchona calisaya]|uniref:Bifunctional inhibitor/plant lipid transfer protein/seed storage helical domain-containing protein n=1 Tax=Cinchona calisaya TaxID=153742 RepID=A0ABD2Y667_9GENT
MAKKLTIFGASFVVLFAVVVAFDMSTLIPNLKILNHKSNKEQTPRCEKKLQKQQLDCCHAYLRESSKFTQQPEIPQMVVNQASSSWREAFPRCCEQLEKISKECRCEAMSQVFQQQMQKGQLQEIEMQEMLQTAQSLPNLCRIKKAQSCTIQMTSF